MLRILRLQNVGLLVLLLWLISQNAVRAEEDPDTRDVDIYVTLVNPQDVSDVFGKRISRRFFAFQVTVANNSKEYQYLIHGITIDIPKAVEKAEKAISAIEASDPQKTSKIASLNEFKSRLTVFTGGLTAYRMSSIDLKLLRGVAEKGSYLDTRNFIIRALRGIGTIAGGIIGVASFGSSYAPSVAAFNGPFISAAESTFPDYTVNQLNRLNDAAYTANSLVPRQQAKVMVVFVPQPFILNKEESKKFYKEPSFFKDSLGIFTATIEVGGSFIKELEGLPPAGVQVLIDKPGDFQEVGREVTGCITGKYLKGASVTLTGDPPLDGVQLEVKGEATNSLCPFIIKHKDPIKPGLRLELLVANKDGNQILVYPVNYVPAPPSIEKITPAEGEQGKIIKLAIEGKGFIPGYTTLFCKESRNITFGQWTVEDNGSIQVEMTIKEDPGEVTLVASNHTGVLAEFGPFKVKAASPAQKPEGQ